MVNEAHMAEDIKKEADDVGKTKRKQSAKKHSQGKSSPKMYV